MNQPTTTRALTISTRSLCIPLVVCVFTHYAPPCLLCLSLCLPLTCCVPQYELWACDGECIGGTANQRLKTHVLLEPISRLVRHPDILAAVERILGTSQVPLPVYACTSLCLPLSVPGHPCLPLSACTCPPVAACLLVPVCLRPVMIASVCGCLWLVMAGLGSSWSGRPIGM